MRFISYSVVFSAWLFVLCLGVLFFTNGLRAETSGDWQLNDLTGKAVKLSDYKGKVVVLNFWATWCPPCKAEIPDFIKLQTEYKGKDVVILGISVDSVQPAEVAAFVKKNGMNYPVLMATEKVEQVYGADEGVPITVVIDRNGKKIDQHPGIVTKSYVEMQVRKAL